MICVGLKPCQPEKQHNRMKARIALDGIQHFVRGRIGILANSATQGNSRQGFGRADAGVFALEENQGQRDRRSGARRGVL